MAADWWEWAVAFAQFHLPECSWNTVGVGTGHCSCGLTRCIQAVQRASTTSASLGECICRSQHCGHVASAHHNGVCELCNKGICWC